jgi:hypothetical protein
MVWSIEYYNKIIEESVLNLPSGLLARYLRLTDLYQKIAEDTQKGTRNS